MRRVLIFLLAIVIFIPLCAVSVSASEYDLGEPRMLSYTYSSTSRHPSNFYFYGRYHYYSYSDEEGNYISGYGGSSLGFSGFQYLNSGNVSSANVLWQLGSNDPGLDFGGRNIALSGIDRSKSCILAYTSSSVREELIFVPFVFENIILPPSGTVFKVSVSFDSALIDIPGYFNSYINTQYLCYFCDTYGAPGYSDRYSLPRMFPSTATVSKNGNIYSYDFYFQFDSIPSGTFSSSNICLAIRIPYYFNSANSFSNGVRILGNAEIPSTYEILTIGGYNQELANIQNAIESSNEKLLELYTNRSESDVVHVLEFESANSELDSSMNDYNDALVPIVSMQDMYTSPPMQSIIHNNAPDLSTVDVKDLFSLSWLVSALTLVFSFCIIRLILYGTKEG